MNLEQTVALRRFINTYVIPAIGVVLCVIAWQLRVRNELLKHPPPPAVARTCPALLEDYRQLHWEVHLCREGFSQNTRALNECRSLNTPRP